jgi:serine/threonine protein kinase
MSELLIPVLPTTIHGFVFTSLLGCGGFGQVYKVSHPRFPDEFAAKVARVSDRDDVLSGHQWQSFDAEVSVLRQLNHPNIIRMYNSFREGNLFIVILEYCPGGDLQNLVDQMGSLSAEMFAEIGSQIVKALSFCHSRGIAHHDIKPSNILFDAYGRPKLADFGLAFVARGLVDRAFAGSIIFEAPELLHKRPYDPLSCDIWALGVTFLVMLQGGNPWGTTCVEHLRQIITLGNYEIRKVIPLNIARLIAAMLTIDPQARPSIGEVAANSCFAARPDPKPRPMESCFGMRKRPIILTPAQVGPPRRGSLLPLNRQIFQQIPEFQRRQSSCRTDNS